MAVERMSNGKGSTRSMVRIDGLRDAECNNSSQQTRTLAPPSIMQYLGNPPARES
jgi:hypothetical protein